MTELGYISVSWSDRSNLAYFITTSTAYWEHTICHKLYIIYPTEVSCPRSQSKSIAESSFETRFSDSNSNLKWDFNYQKLTLKKQNLLYFSLSPLENCHSTPNPLGISTSGKIIRSDWFQSLMSHLGTLWQLPGNFYLPWRASLSSRVCCKRILSATYSQLGNVCFPIYIEEFVELMICSCRQGALITKTAEQDPLASQISTFNFLSSSGPLRFAGCV